MALDVSFPTYVLFKSSSDLGFKLVFDSDVKEFGFKCPSKLDIADSRHMQFARDLSDTVNSGKNDFQQICIISAASNSPRDCKDALKTICVEAVKASDDNFLYWAKIESVDGENCITELAAFRWDQEIPAKITRPLILISKVEIHLPKDSLLMNDSKAPAKVASPTPKVEIPKPIRFGFSTIPQKEATPVKSEVPISLTLLGGKSALAPVPADHHEPINHF